MYKRTPESVKKFVFRKSLMGDGEEENLGEEGGLRTWKQWE